MKSQFVKSMNNKYVKLERTYCNKSQLEIIEKYCNAMDYTLKFKTFKAEQIRNNTTIKIDKYFDLIIEKKLKNGKKRHGFISVFNDNIEISYKRLRENITYLVTGISNELKPEARIVFEPIMFVEFNVY